MAEFTDGIAVGMAIVRPTGGIVVPKTLGENGIYYAADDDADGYDPVTVAVPIGGKMITKNGVYHAADDDLRGYDPVNVSVPMYWTFPPGETVPPSMIDPEYPREEDAPPSSEEVPHPTPEDPQRLIKPQFRFDYKGEVYDEGNPFVVYGGQIYDADTDELLEEVYTSHPWGNFTIKYWEFSGRTLRVEYRYDWFDPGVTYWDTIIFITDVGGYTAKSTDPISTTVHGG